MQRNKQLGFTIIELITVIGILGLISVGVSSLAFWGMRLWNITRDHVRVQDEARTSLESMASAIREMQISDNGSYPIEVADHDTLTFYTNVDSDNNREKIKYELQNGTIYRWLAESTSDSPPQYPAFSDTTKTAVVSLVTNAEDIFSYYDNTYNGTTPALTEPVTLASISLVKIRLLIDYDPIRTPAPMELITNVTLRNLKNNL